MTVKANVDIASIAGRFQLAGEYSDARPYGTGHIHDTYLVDTHVPVQTIKKTVPYIFQEINQRVFPDPPRVMENIVRVTRHVRQKLEKRGIPGEEINRRVLTVIPTREGDSYCLDPEGHYWRAYIFIEKARSLDVLQSYEQMYRVAYKFGEFMAMLRDLPGPPLNETIPDFHNGPKRMNVFRDALASDPHNRAKTAGTDIDFLLAHASMFDVLPTLSRQGKIPPRVTHNDTKVNNVMLDEITGQGVCVIDLDTVMMGLSLFDFGDLVRSTLSSTAEDDRDLSGVSVELPRFEVILKGFLDGTGQGLNRTEMEYLVFSAELMTLMIGMRFLTDYLLGDVYFKIHRIGHNLDRCRRQFKLVQSIIDHEEEMNALVSDGSEPF